MAYATVCELQVNLGIENPTPVQTAGMQRCLDEAAAEIDWELGFDPTDNPAPSPPHPLMVGVNLDRAVEHWRQAKSPFGLIGIGVDTVPIIAGRDSWYRHHLKLKPLRMLQGIA